MKKSSLLLFGLVLFFSVVRPLHADADGCIDSPENPTAILAVVGVEQIARFLAERPAVGVDDAAVEARLVLDDDLESL